MGVRVRELPMVLAALVLGIGVAVAQTLPETCLASPGTPPVELEGCCTKATCAAVPAEMVIGPLVAGVSPASAACSV